MKKGILAKNQAVEIVGIVAVEEVERKNCEPTNRVGYNGCCQGDDETEWSASVQCNDSLLIAYYYTSNDEDACMESHEGDGSSIVWEITGYEIL